MTTTHTPGPWRVARGKIARNMLHLAIMADNGDMPCSVTPMDALRPIDEANARLIAAAPELLHELKRALNGLEEAVEMGTVAACTATRIDNARAAIAKAEGENTND